MYQLVTKTNNSNRNVPTMNTIYTMRNFRSEYNPKNDEIKPIQATKKKYIQHPINTMGARCAKSTVSFPEDDRSLVGARVRPHIPSVKIAMEEKNSRRAVVRCVAAAMSARLVSI